MVTVIASLAIAIIGDKDFVVGEVYTYGKSQALKKF